jgi:hypothetical protein
MLSLEEKIMGLSLIWKEAEYNFPFWSKINGLNWDDEYEKALSNILKIDTLLEYYLELSRFISLLRDGHTGITFPREIIDSAGRFPINIGLLENKCIIWNTDEALNIPLYSEIIEINNIPVFQYIKENIYPYCWHEKDSGFSQVNLLLPLIEHGNELLIKTEYGTYKTLATCNTINWNKLVNIKPNDYLKKVFTSKTHTISLTDDNIAVINIPSFMDDSLPKEFYQNINKIKDCKGFIIDIRNNSGGNSDNADAIVQSFIDGEFVYSCDKKLVHIGTYKAWGKFQNLDNINLDDEWNRKLYDICNRQYFEKNTVSKRIDGCPITLTKPLVVLENEGTASAAEDMLICFDYSKRATIVGTPSYGSTGQPLIFDLPGGGFARICTRWNTYPDGKEFINIGVQPHIYAEATISDMKNGYDGVLDKGISVLRDIISKS